MQIHRLFEIVYILLQHKIVTAQILAEHFGVSARTIYRDIDVLSLANIPIYTEKGKGGGISLLPDFVLNKSILSDQEQNEILSALRGLSTVRTAETGNVLQKLSTIFNKTADNWLEVDFTPWSNENGEVFNDLKKAILERRIAKFNYYSIYGKKNRKKTSRIIEPHQLWFKSMAWYVRGYCLTRQEIRTFKLTRISNLRITNEHFNERDLSKTGSAKTDEHQMQDITLKLKIEPEMVHRVYDEFDESIIKKQKDGSFIVTVNWPEDDWVYGRILSYGEYIKVLSPPHIREIIRKKAIKMTKNYV